MTWNYRSIINLLHFNKNIHYNKIPTRPPKEEVRYSSSVVSKSHASPLQHLLYTCLFSKVKQKLHRLSGAPFHSAVCHAFCCSAFFLMAASTVLQAALLISPAFHFRASLRKLRSTSLRSIPAPFLSATCSPPAAHVWLACWSPPAAGLSWFL